MAETATGEMIEVKKLVKNKATGQLEEQVIARQLRISPDVPRLNPPWVSEREEYLFERGWEKEPSITGGLPTYRDPKGSSLNGQMKYIKHLPNKKDEMHPEGDPLHQLIIPPAFGSYTLDEAVAMQTRRDSEGEGGLTPLERVAVVEERCNQAELELRRVRATIKGILINTQLTVQGLRMGLRELFGWTGDNADDWKI